MFTDLLPPCRGQSPMEADLNLLETARRCELFGVKMHPVKVRLCRRMTCEGKDASLRPIWLLLRYWDTGHKTQVHIFHHTFLVLCLFCFFVWEILFYIPNSTDFTFYMKHLTHWNSKCTSKLYIQLSARVVAQHVVVAGPRGGVPHPGGGAPGGPRVPDQHQDQHILLGQGPQAQLQEEEVPDQAPPRGLRKWTLYCGQFSDISPPNYCYCCCRSRLTL